MPRLKPASCLLPVSCVLLAVVFSSCAQTGRPGPSEPLLHEEEEARRAAPPAPAPAPVEPSKPVPLKRTGTITRDELLTVLSTSPGAFLQHVDAEARLTNGRFTGWRIKAFFPGDPRFTEVDLHAGDVVVRVNGRILERPEHLMAAWQALKTATELTVEVERAGAPHTLRWKIASGGGNVGK